MAPRCSISNMAANVVFRMVTDFWGFEKILSTKNVGYLSTAISSIENEEKNIQEA